MSTYRPKFLENVIQRIETKALALLLALVLAIAGIAMIYSALRDDGVIHLRAALIEGELKTGSVGVLVLFLSTVITLSCIWRPAKPHTFEVTHGNRSFKWTAKVGSVDHNLIARLQDVIKTLNDNDHSDRRLGSSEAPSHRATGGAKRERSF